MLVTLHFEVLVGAADAALALVQRTCDTHEEQALTLRLIEFFKED